MPSPRGGSQWGYLDPNSVRENMLQGMPTGEFGALAGQYGQRAGQQFGMQSQLFNQGMGLMQGDSPILEAMRRQQGQQLGDIGGQQMMQQNRAMAARGMGGGGLSDILGMKTTSALGEQSRQGLLGIQQYGLQAGQGFGQLGGQMFGAAAGLGQAGIGAFRGAQGTQQDLLSLQTGANEAAANQMAANFEAKQKYAAQQAAQKSAFGGKVGGLIGQGVSAYMGWK